MTAVLVSVVPASGCCLFLVAVVVVLAGGVCGGPGDVVGVEREGGPTYTPVVYIHVVVKKREGKRERGREGERERGRKREGGKRD